jgi:hypothetical protein
MTNTLTHRLISLPLADGMTLHAYVMSNDPDIVERVTNKMLDEVERHGLPVLVPLFVSSTLSELTTHRLRKFIMKTNPPAKQVLRDATDFHLSIFMSNEAWLNEIH